MKKSGTEDQGGTSVRRESRIRHGLLLLCVALVMDGLALQVEAATVAPEEKILNVYNWSEYIGSDTISNFEKEYGIKVHYDNFDSNEILHAKLALRKTGYDIVVPSANWASMQIKGGLLKKIDKSRLPNLSNLDPAIESQLAKLDPGNDYLVPWLWGYTTVGINAAEVRAALGKLPMPDNPWDLVFDEKYVSKLKSCGVSFLDAPSEILPPALSYVGKNPFSNTPSDYALAEQLLLKIRSYVTLFSTTGYINDLANGAICVAIGWSGDINVARRRAIAAKNGHEIVTLLPRKGAVLSYEAMAIPVDAPHPENALLWMNYIMRPEVQAGLTNKVSYASPNLASRKFIRKELLEDKTLFLSDADIKNMVTIQVLEPETKRLATRVYSKFKSGL